MAEFHEILTPRPYPPGMPGASSPTGGHPSFRRRRPGRRVMTMRQVVTIVGLAALFAWPAGARQQSADPEGLFQAALYKEQVELKLEQAIAGYADVVARGSSSRALAAKALLQMAGCYERLGRPEARATYE